jgi:uncharacterized protein
MPRTLHIPLATQPVMPWANGGGVTRQVAIDPPGASLATGFRWRLSRAQVAGDGPFSRLPGVDRSLWLLRGNGLLLDVEGRELRLDRELQRFDFAGELAIHARCLDGPIEDLNLMVARDRVRATAAVVAFERGAAIDLEPAAERLLLVLAGSIEWPGGPVVRDGDAVRIDGGDLRPLRAVAAGRLLAVGFEPVEARS